MRLLKNPDLFGSAIFMSMSDAALTLNTDDKGICNLWTNKELGKLA
jgi:hypothetical protein